MFRKVVLFLDACVDRFVLFSATIALCVSTYATYDAAMVYYHANDTGILKYKPPVAGDPGPLKELSPDAVAWLTLEGTSIDFPVMQGKNNTDYVNKDPYGNFSLSGSVFLDTRNAPDFSDPYSLLYGHHMEYGAMFGSLDEYLDKGYLDAHRTGTLTTTSGKAYAIRLFASMNAPSATSLIFDPEATRDDELVAYAQAQASAYDSDASPTAQILALTTCTAADDLNRTIVLGYLSPLAHSTPQTEASP